MLNPEVAKRIKAGAKVRVHEKQGFFEGLVLARKHGLQSGASFTVRATVAGVGVEKVYPLHSPTIVKVDVLSSPKKVGRSKLYFIRDLSPRRIREKLGTN
jgi:large subunit ribosomal protein L19